MLCDNCKEREVEIHLTKVENENFELAAELRDRIRVLE